MKQTKLRTENIKPNNNISFPIGTICAVQKYSQKLGFNEIFSKYKKRGISLVGLLEALLSYRLSENLSTTKASDWINRIEVLEEFCIKSFEERTLYRLLEIIGKNYEEIIMALQESLFSHYDFPHTDTNLDWTSIVLWGKHANLGIVNDNNNHTF